MSIVLDRNFNDANSELPEESRHVKKHFIGTRWIHKPARGIQGKMALRVSAIILDATLIRVSIEDWVLGFRIIYLRGHWPQSSVKDVWRKARRSDWWVAPSDGRIAGPSCACKMPTPFYRYIQPYFLLLHTDGLRGLPHKAHFFAWNSQACAYSHPRVCPQSYTCSFRGIEAGCRYRICSVKQWRKVIMSYGMPDSFVVAYYRLQEMQAWSHQS